MLLYPIKVSLSPNTFRSIRRRRYTRRGETGIRKRLDAMNESKRTPRQTQPRVMLPAATTWLQPRPLNRRGAVGQLCATFPL